MQCSGIQTLHNLFIIYSATNMRHRSFKASFPQKLHLQQQRRLEPCLSSSRQPFWPCLACGCWCHQPHVQLDGGARQECQALGNKSWPKKGHTIRQLIFNWGHLKVTMKPVVRRGKIRAVGRPVLHSTPTPASHEPVTKDSLQEVQGGIGGMDCGAILESEGGIG